MESLSDTHWDVVISGTGLHQSLLALALSRSGKNILHVDENVYYGDAEAAFSLDEVDEWAAKYRSAAPGSLFAEAEVVSKDVDQLASSRSYSIALAPQMVHAGSTLLSQLVASKAYRQIEFLAVGSFYIFQPPNESSPESPPSLSRVPSTREDVFANTAIPARSKRFLMKFLKFVLDYESEPQTDLWRPHAEEPLAGFLGSEFKLDTLLQSYVTTLTLSLDGDISVRDGLAAIHRHMTSMGRFGTGFAAVYPKWGGLSEVAQVGCRAAAVGGAIYMLGTGINTVKTSTESGDAEIALSNDVVVKTKSLVQTQDGQTSSSKLSLSRLTAVTKSDFSTLFQSTVEGAPVPAVAVVGFPPGSVTDTSGAASEYPVYAMVHSSDTGECPVGQCVVYLSTVSTPNATTILKEVLAGLLDALAADHETPKPLFELQYEQKGVLSAAPEVDAQVINLPPPSLDLAFNDTMMVNVEKAWEALTKDDEKPEGTEYMKFNDREGADVDDDEF